MIQNNFYKPVRQVRCYDLSRQREKPCHHIQTRLTDSQKERWDSIKDELHIPSNYELANQAVTFFMLFWDKADVMVENFEEIAAFAEDLKK